MSPTENRPVFFLSLSSLNRFGHAFAASAVDIPSFTPANGASGAAVLPLTSSAVLPAVTWQPSPADGLSPLVEAPDFLSPLLLQAASTIIKTIRFTARPCSVLPLRSTQESASPAGPTFARGRH